MNLPSHGTTLANSVCRGLITSAMHAFSLPEQTDRPERERGRTMVDLIITSAQDGGFGKADQLMAELQKESSMTRPPLTLINEAVGHIEHTKLALILGKMRRSEWS
jgi:hypothetical protein